MILYVDSGNKRNAGHQRSSERMLASTSLRWPGFVAAFMLLVACQPGPEEHPPASKMIFYQSMTEQSDEKITSLGFREGVAWFNGIYFNNEKARTELILREISFRRFDDGLELVGIYLTTGAALPKHLFGLRIGACSETPYPPKPYQREEVEGYRLRQHETIFPMIGVKNNTDQPQVMEGLRLTYELDGVSYSEEYPYRAELQGQKTRCPKDHGL